MARSRCFCALAFIVTIGIVGTHVHAAETGQSPKQHVTFYVAEGSRMAATYPPVGTPQTVGSTAVYATELKNPQLSPNTGTALPEPLKVGSVVWTGTYVSISGESAIVNYLVNFEVTEGTFKGTIIASGIGDGVHSKNATTRHVMLGGTGDFEGATGTITWGAPISFNSNPGVYYTFELALAPKSKVEATP